MKNSFSYRHWLLIVTALAFGPVQLRAAVMNIEIDYMVDNNPVTAHSHMPQPDEIAAVVQMFACHGITLNIIVDQAIPHSDVMPHDPSDKNNFFGYSGSTSSFGYLRSQYFNHQGQSGWHYCIFGHQYMGSDGNVYSSGQGQISGANFVVTLGTFTNFIGTPFERASSLAHEFGHNLGLHHGGFGNSPPNKPSIMSYFYQLYGVRANLIAHGLTTAQASLFKDIDYSDGTMCTLNENLLDETFGSGMNPVDWNCDTTIGGVISASIDDNSSWCGATNIDRNILSDVNEWAAIHDPTLALDDPLAKIEDVSCITSKEVAKYRSRLAANDEPTLTIEPCVGGKMIYLETSGSTANSGTCSSPLSTLGSAQAKATDGSHLFLLPGTFTQDAGAVLLNRPMTIFCNIGTATINPH